MRHEIYNLLLYFIYDHINTPSKIYAATIFPALQVVALAATYFFLLDLPTHTIPSFTIGIWGFFYFSAIVQRTANVYFTDQSIFSFSKYSKSQILNSYLIMTAIEAFITLNALILLLLLSFKITYIDAVMLFLCISIFGWSSSTFVMQNSIKRMMFRPFIATIMPFFLIASPIFFTNRFSADVQWIDVLPFSAVYNFSITPDIYSGSIFVGYLLIFVVYKVKNDQS